MNLQDYNKVSVPIFEFNPDGSIKPNPLFHRSWDKLHSRCIEYPYAASKLSKEQRILDVGTAKADKAWIDWLESLPIEVHATDYDEMEVPLKTVKFTQGDVRSLPFDENYFDAILAVSVIEHIGLEDAQVNAEIQPEVGISGDVMAVKELRRILKPGGKLIMTFPFSKNAFIYANSARIYDSKGIQEFNSILSQQLFDYYEYQTRDRIEHKLEFFKSENSYRKGKPKFFKRTRQSKLSPKREMEKILNDTNHISNGSVTWRKIEPDNCAATHYRHIDGVFCGIWEK